MEPQTERNRAKLALGLVLFFSAAMAAGCGGADERCVSGAECKFNEFCGSDGRCTKGPEPCTGGICNQCPAGADCQAFCRSDADCRPGTTCGDYTHSCPGTESCGGDAICAGSLALCGQCVVDEPPIPVPPPPPTPGSCQGSSQADCMASPGCQPIFSFQCFGGGAGGGEDGGVPRDVGGSNCVQEPVFQYCAPRTCAAVADEGTCEQRSDCLWVAGGNDMCPVCDCFDGGACECPACPQGQSARCQDRSPIVCADGSIAQNGLCPPPPPSCAPGTLLTADGSCQPACTSDVDCGAGSSCTTSIGDCYSDPACSVDPGFGCSDVCYGVCQAVGDRCASLDVGACTATPECELVREEVFCDCPPSFDGGVCNCADATQYRCSAATGRVCQGLDELECGSREDCVTERCGDCPPGAACFCASGTFTGCRDPQQSSCTGLDEASCNADGQSCRSLYTGSGCTCDPAGDCTCQSLTFQECDPR